MGPKKPRMVVNWGGGGAGGDKVWGGHAESWGTQCGAVEMLRLRCCLRLRQRLRMQQMELCSAMSTQCTCRSSFRVRCRWYRASIVVDAPSHPTARKWYAREIGPVGWGVHPFHLYSWFLTTGYTYN